MDSSLVQVGPFAFDRQRMTLMRDGRAQAIGSRGAALLGALVDANGAVVSKERLLAAAWPDSIVEDANLTVQMAALRKALGARTDGKDWIATVPREGYRLVADQDGAPNLTRPSIAVLPFANLSSDPEQDYFADGVVEDLITALSRFKTFAVVARNSSFVYKGRAVDVREAARELGVRYVLEGSVRRAGNRVRVTAQLIAGATGEHLWAEKFDGDIADIFDVQDTIASSVIGLIEPQIHKAEIERARRKRPENFDAWDLYIQALPLVHGSEVSRYTEAIDLLDHAVELEPNWAPGLALAAWAHEKRHTFAGVAPEGLDEAELALSLARRAVECDPDDAFALALLGWLRILFRRDYAGTTLVDRAVALNPNNVLVLLFAGTTYLFAGDLNDTIACGTRVIQLSPGGPENYAALTHVAQGHLDLGNFDEAVTWAQRAIDANPNYVFGYLTLGCALAHLGRVDEAKIPVQRAVELQPTFTLRGISHRPMRYPERRAIWVDGLRIAGLPEG